MIAEAAHKAMIRAISAGGVPFADEAKITDPAFRRVWSQAMGLMGGIYDVSVHTDQSIALLWMEQVKTRKWIQAAVAAQVALLAVAVIAICRWS